MRFFKIYSLSNMLNLLFTRHMFREYSWILRQKATLYLKNYHQRMSKLMLHSSICVGIYMGKRMPQIPFCDVICGSEVKRVWVAFPPLLDSKAGFYVPPRNYSIRYLFGFHVVYSIRRLYQYNEDDFLI